MEKTKGNTKNRKMYITTNDYWNTKERKLLFLRRKKIRNDFSKKIKKYKKIKKRDLYGRRLGYVKQILERTMKKKKKKRKN